MDTNEKNYRIMNLLKWIRITSKDVVKIVGKLIVGTYSLLVDVG
jgi:hypothetical protein